MKKLTILLILGIMVSLPLKAQVTPFKFEIGGLYGLPTDNAYKGGVGFYAHPSYYLNDNLNLGIKAEGVILGGADDLGTNVTISAIASYMVTSNYYFGVSKVRPYFGLGAGLFSLGSVSMDDGSGNTANFEYGDKFGAEAKAGLDLGHFTLNVAYNMIFGIDSHLAKKDYLTVGIGVFFGGGVKGKGGSKSKYITIDEDEDI
ncbi:MAG: hypothetical protein P1P88_05575 [Bacteroidales bacterium]|nr:hypothetical protein [Bacteroidales bacterium]